MKALIAILFIALTPLVAKSDFPRFGIVVNTPRVYVIPQPPVYYYPQPPIYYPQPSVVYYSYPAYVQPVYVVPPSVYVRPNYLWLPPVVRVETHSNRRDRH